MQFLNVKQVSERLGCSIPKVRELFEAGRLLGVNLGGANRKVWKISEENLQRFTNGETQPPTRGRRTVGRVDAHVKDKWF
jgi:hypothetical protein